MFRFTIRELVMLTTIVALAICLFRARKEGRIVASHLAQVSECIEPDGWHVERLPRGGMILWDREGGAYFVLDD